MQLTPNLTTVLFEILNFLVLAFLLYRFLFRPVMRSVKARAAEKAKLIQQVRQEREHVEALRAELEERLRSAEAEAAAIITGAKEQAEADRATLLQETGAEVQRLLSEAQVDAYQLKRQAIDEFHEELLDAVLEVSGLVIGRVAPSELHDALVKQLYDRIWELGRSEMERVETLRRSLGERTPTVVARTAKPLSPEQQGQLVRTFTALADRNVNVDLKVEPALGIGVRVRIGDIVVDNSVAGKLEELRSSVSEALTERVADE